jgi:hypothetical protein
MSEPVGQVTKDFVIVGTMFVIGGTTLMERVPMRSPLKPVREPTNPADPNAIAIYYGDKKLGFVPRGLAAELAPLMDAGVTVIMERKADKRFGLCRVAYIPPQGVPNADEQSAGAPGIAQ